MIGLPQDGQLVRIWPRPGRKVQHGTRPLDARGGGRWLTQCDEGTPVVWGPFFHEQFRAGDILLHAPGPQAHALKAAPEEAFDFAKASSKHMDEIAPAKEPKPEVT